MSPVIFTLPVSVVSPNVASPLTNRLLVILTSLLGIRTSPVPLARNSKFELVSVVVIKLSSIKILPLLISPAIVKLPVCVVLPT